MNTSKLLSTHFHSVYFGGNWTDVNLQQLLKDVSWERALQKVGDVNTIATLVFHINYFVDVVIRVLEEGKLEGSDKLSFDHPPIESKGDWDNFVDNVLQQGKKLSALLADFPEDRLETEFFDPKYGNYYRNFQGIIEHTHYHLGQISLVKKLTQQS